jgi:hypothetical protein
MPHDTEFTHSLFDNTALSGWSPDTLQAVATPDDGDEAGTDADGLDEDGDTPPSPACPAPRGSNFHLTGERALARGWPARARDNIAAITLSKALEQSGRAPTADEQAQLLRFIGFGASELAQNCFRRPGEDEFRSGWQEIGTALEAAVTPDEYAALQRATQYAHYTPETIIRGLWRAAERLGFCGGRVLEPGMGTGLFFALLPATLREACQLTGIEYDPITARIARLVHPEARVRSAWCWPITSRAPLGCDCTTTSSPVRSPAFARAGSRCSSPAPARWTRPAPRHGNTSPAWLTWWAPCVCPRAACGRAQAPMW